MWQSFVLPCIFVHEENLQCVSNLLKTLHIPVVSLRFWKIFWRESRTVRGLVWTLANHTFSHTTLFILEKKVQQVSTIFPSITMLLFWLHFSFSHSFLYVEHSLHLWNEAYLNIVHDPSGLFFAWIFKYYFYICAPMGNWSIILFSLSLFVLWVSGQLWFHKMNWVMFLFSILEFCKEYLPPKGTNLDAKILVKLWLHLLLCVLNPRFQRHLFVFSALIFHHF